MNLLTFPRDIGIWMVEFIALSHKWAGLVNLFLKLKIWRCSDSPFITLYRQPALLFSNENWSIIVLLNKGPFSSRANFLHTVLSCLRLFYKPAGFVTDGTVFFSFLSFFYLWILSLRGKKAIDQKIPNIWRGNIFLSISRNFTT